MALSLLYIPRSKKWFTLGKVRTWYQFHVLTGLLGPMLIFFHAYGKYYGVGGLTLAAVWMVMATGVIGHYLRRRLPEEVQNRVGRHSEQIVFIEELEKQAERYAIEMRRLTSELSRESTLTDLVDEAKIKLPKASLGKGKGSIRRVCLDYWSGSRRLRVLRKRIKTLNQQQLNAHNQKAQRLASLFKLERDARDLLLLNEVFSLWRKMHVPLAWFLWVLAGSHIFAWIYY